MRTNRNKENTIEKQQKNKPDTEKKISKTSVGGAVVFLLYGAILAALAFLMFQKGQRGYPNNPDQEIQTEKLEVLDGGRDLSEQDILSEQENTELKVYGMVTVSRRSDYYPDDRTASVYNGQKLKDNGCTYAVKINRQQNVVTVYSLDKEGYYTVPVKAMCCSVSSDDTTPEGLFTTSDRFEWALLEGGVYGQYAYKIVGGILFHSVPYKSYGHDKLETWEFNKLGTGASLGCIRLCVADAKWIFYHCEAGTQVNIFDSDYVGPLGRPQPAFVFEDVENTDWDPTDEAYGNPYMQEPHIYGLKSHSIEKYEPFDPYAGVLAFNSSGENVTANIAISGMVDTSRVGDYDLCYSFWENGKKISETITISVIDSVPPIITQAPEELSVVNYTGDEQALAALIGDYITAYDEVNRITEIFAGTFNKQSKSTGAALSEDGKATDNGNKTAADGIIYIDTSKVRPQPGQYYVRCTAVDLQGNSSEEIMILIHVIS